MKRRMIPNTAMRTTQRTSPRQHDIRGLGQPRWHAFPIRSHPISCLIFPLLFFDGRRYPTPRCVHPNGNLYDSITHTQDTPHRVASSPQQHFTRRHTIFIWSGEGEAARSNVEALPGSLFILIFSCKERACMRRLRDQFQIPESFLFFLLTMNCERIPKTPRLNSCSLEDSGR
jgi:hypothetical protein